MEFPHWKQTFDLFSGLRLVVVAADYKMRIDSSIEKENTLVSVFPQRHRVRISNKTSEMNDLLEEHWSPDDTAPAVGWTGRSSMCFQRSSCCVPPQGALGEGDQILHRPLTSKSTVSSQPTADSVSPHSCLYTPSSRMCSPI